MVSICPLFQQDSIHRLPSSPCPKTFLETRFYLAAALIVATIGCPFAQSKKFNEELTLSIPFVYNKYEVTNLIGPSRQIEGKGWSNGINLSYSRNFFNELFVTAGFGYYNQVFNIHRPFDYSTPLFPLFTTSEYSYKSIQWLIGVGYTYSLKKNYSIKGIITYNQFQSFVQVYQPETNNPEQVNNNNFHFSNSFAFSLGVHKKIAQEIVLGSAILLPIGMMWRKDKIFEEDSSEFNKSKSAIGFNITIGYIF